MKLKKIKKSQEEIVGFVLIIVLVSIIALVFLGIMLRKKPELQNSLEIQDFLQAMSKITTNCTISFEPQYLDLAELTKSCLDNEECLNNQASCEILNKTLIKLMDDSWNVCDECPKSYYNLTIQYMNKTYYELEKGECVGSREGGWYAVYYFGDNIITSLEMCTKT